MDCFPQPCWCSSLNSLVCAATSENLTKFCLKNARRQWVFYGVCKLGYLYDISLHFVCLENSHLLIQTTEQVWDNLENIPIKTPIFPHFLWYLHQGRSVKSMNRTVAFDYKPWQCLGEKLHLGHIMYCTFT